MIGPLPLGGPLAQKDVPRGVEPSREDLDSTAVTFCQNSGKDAFVKPRLVFVKPHRIRLEQQGSNLFGPTTSK